MMEHRLDVNRTRGPRTRLHPRVLHITRTRRTLRAQRLLRLRLRLRPGPPGAFLQNALRRSALPTATRRDARSGGNLPGNHGRVSSRTFPREPTSTSTHAWGCTTATRRSSGNSSPTSSLGSRSWYAGRAPSGRRATAPSVTRGRGWATLTRTKKSRKKKSGRGWATLKRCSRSTIPIRIRNWSWPSSAAT